MKVDGHYPERRTVETLLRLVSPAGPRPDLAAVDWHPVVRLARHAHVAASLWARLRVDPDFAAVPEAAADDLRAAYRDNARRNRLMVPAFLDLARRLNAEGIVPVLLKGGGQLFDPPSGDPDRRYLHDFDLLVAGPEPVYDRLLASGLAVAETAPPRGRPERMFHSWPDFVDRESGVIVDVHRRPFRYADAAMTAIFLDEAIPFERDGARFALPSRACRIAGNVLHAQIADRGFSQAWFDPRYLLELAECAVAWRAADWRDADILLASHRIAFRNFIHLAQMLMGVAVPLPPPRRRVDQIELERILRHDDFAPRHGLLAWTMMKAIGLKARARQAVGPSIGWRSVSPRRSGGSTREEPF
ncbi:nucleotidyltransferase family protein [Prosthecomicrobium pneumaticum]|uniref:Nucleotidyltransferase family protein n=1 Tax=Prosthecomicrobium pneumaticum TaxID=81895 RepID=A0A7W9FQW4_9HYPH|nr:nucleotidyltransferase family protein [Prosthecomicrobium pneumaticum]MBB5755148.1 hypothetical protein [Prosthecomicrobium pneumaticum]